MAERAKVVESWGTAKYAAANSAVCEKGNVACLNGSGLVVPAGTGTGLLPIGHFMETMTGNGTTKVAVKFFKEKTLVLFLNSANPNDVAADDMGKIVYLAGPSTVTTSSSSNSPAGRVFGVTAEGVFVEPAGDLGPQGPQGEPGE